MAYTKGIISIPNVTGDISITVTTASVGFSFDMDRTVVRRSVTTDSFYSNSSEWDETKVYDNVVWMNGTSSNSNTATLTDKTSNSVTVTLSGAQTGACYPIKVKGGKTYTLNYDYSGTGSVRAYYITNVDGSVSTLHELYVGTDGEEGHKTHTITIPAGTECWLFLTLGANTNKTKSYTNVSLVEVQ